MFERFTSATKDAVIRAQADARTLAHPTVTAAHVLVAIARDSSSTGGRTLAGLGFDPSEANEALGRSILGPSGMLDDEDADALRALGIDVDDVRRAVESSFGPGALERAHERWAGRDHIPFAPESKKALELSLREALRLGHRHIGTEHALLGLVRDTRTSAVALLRSQGISPDDVQRAVAAEIDARRPGHTA